MARRSLLHQRLEVSLEVPWPRSPQLLRLPPLRHRQEPLQPPLPPRLRQQLHRFSAEVQLRQQQPRLLRSLEEAQLRQLLSLVAFLEAVLLPLLPQHLPQHQHPLHQQPALCSAPSLLPQRHRRPRRPLRQLVPRLLLVSSVLSLLPPRELPLRLLHLQRRPRLLRLQLQGRSTQMFRPLGLRHRCPA